MRALIELRLLLQGSERGVDLIMMEFRRFLHAIEELSLRTESGDWYRRYLA